MRVLRSIGILVIAYFAIGTVVGVVDNGLSSTFPQSLPDKATGRLPDSGWLLWHVAEVGLITVASSYLAALMAGRAEVEHLTVLGAWMVCVGLGTFDRFAGWWPLWYGVSIMAVPIPAVFFGGYLRVRQKRVRGQTSQEEGTRHIVRRAVLWGIGLAILLAAHDYQNDPMYRRHFSIRSMFWYSELPFLVVVGALLGYAVGVRRRTKQMHMAEGPSTQSGA